ncbi:hypothetical protein IH574_06620, partial [Candidatus Bathyarchaeota archaeon]|nr:hypothetical protein [Candidatus Bathyarchaeota archaeon]
MPRSKVDLKSVDLGEAAKRFLETKTPSTKEAYDKCLKRFAYFYENELERFIGEIEDQMESNEGRPLSERIRPGEATIRDFIKWHKENEYAPKSTRQG